MNRIESKLSQIETEPNLNYNLNRIEIEPNWTTLKSIQIIIEPNWNRNASIKRIKSKVKCVLEKLSPSETHVLVNQWFKSHSRLSQHFCYHEFTWVYNLKHDHFVDKLQWIMTPKNNFNCEFNWHLHAFKAIVLRSVFYILFLGAPNWWELTSLSNNPSSKVKQWTWHTTLTMHTVLKATIILRF